MSYSIKNMPSRLPELGRCRLGEKGAKGQPVKGDFLRFTSNDLNALADLARQLGGTVEPWGEEQTHQLTTTSKTVPVLLPADPIDTSYERWGSGGCLKRCDGELCVMPVMDPEGGRLVESPCDCLAKGLTPGDRDDMKRGGCQVTVRLRLVIPSVAGLGIWLCTSHSIYAAMELPGQIALIQSAAARGALIPAEFGIEQRTEKKPWEKYARHYIVPVIRVLQSLVEIQAGASSVGEAGLPPGSSASPAAISDGRVSGPQNRLGAEAQQGDAVDAPAPVSVSDESGELASDADLEELRAWAARLDAPGVNEVSARLRTEAGLGSINPKAPASQRLLASQVPAFRWMLAQVQDEVQDPVWTTRRKAANAAMSKVGVKTADARHELMRTATAGATESSAQLSVGQLDAIRMACAALADADGEAVAAGG